MIFRDSRLALLAAAALVACAGCATREGALTSPQAGTGLLVVREKNGLPARIFVDGEPTGLDTRQGVPVKLPLGRHVVRLLLGRHRPTPESLVVDLGAGGQEAEFEMIPAPSGHLKLGSAPGGADVRINGMRVGSTPIDSGGSLEVTELPAGTYRAEFRYGNYSSALSVQVEAGAAASVRPALALRRHAWVEDFTNTSCDGCPEVAAMIRENLLRRGDPRALAVEVHASFPSPNDPMHQASRIPLKVLEKQYLPAFLPAVFFNGAKLEFGQDIGRVGSLLDSALATLDKAPALANILLFPGGRRHGWVKVQAVGGPIEKARLRVAILQEKVAYPSPPGTNRQTVFHNVLRDLLNGGEGKPVTLAQGDEEAVEYEFDLSGFPPEGLFLAAYLQRESDLAILQSNHGPLGTDGAGPVSCDRP